MSVVESFRRLLQLVEDRMVRRMVFSSLHPYRVSSQNLATDRINLQAVNEGAVLLPQLVEIPKAHGLQGARERCRPGSIVLVGFQGGSPGAPFVAAYLPATPLELEIDATTEVRVGPSAAQVTLAGGVLPLAVAAPVQALAAALGVFAGAVADAPDLATIKTAAAALQSTLSGISGYATTKVRGV